MKTITIDEYHKTIGDILRSAREGEQTAVVGDDGKIQMVIGVGKNYPFPVEDDIELEDVDVPDDLPRSTWLD